MSADSIGRGSMAAASRLPVSTEALPADASRDTALAPTLIPASDGPEPVRVDVGPLEEAAFGERYRHERVLGRGGMGEVRLCHDERIGREVALKVMRAGSGARAEVVARFLREARVQAQLDHPAIVPVYDLGVGADGAPYFTMKRLRGMTLEHILEAHRRGDPELVARYSQRKLLTELVNVCQAVEFAHSRGVIHRDLKPGNIMLGDFGEIYVLDWGVARIAGVADDADGAVTDGAFLSGDIATGVTAAGAVLGTPGYMPPEQLRGELVDARADVYALGAILFEILTLTPLHPPQRPRTGGADPPEPQGARPSERAPERDIAPELDRICERACDPNPSRRHGSVRELLAPLEAYLDGDRDLVRRRELAAEHAARATAALERAMAADGTAADRSEAIREASRALALEPGDERAQAVIGRLMLEPPREVPPEVEERIEEAAVAAARIEARGGALAYLGYFTAWPIAIAMGVREPLWLGLIGVAILVMAAQAYVGYRLPRGMAAPGLYAAAVFNAVFLGLFSRAFGPFILVPGMFAITTCSFMFHHKVRPAVVFAIGLVGVTTPYLLELAGWIPSSYAFVDGTIVVRPQLLSFPPVATQLMLAFSAAGLVAGGALIVLTLRRQQVANERKLELQAWHLRQAMPAPPPPAASRPPTTGS